MAKQGDFIRQLKERKLPETKPKFQWANNLAKPAKEMRPRGKLGGNLIKQPESPLGTDIPKTYDGKIDRKGIEADLTRIVKKQRKVQK